MPILPTIALKNSMLYAWHITETLEELQALAQQKGLAIANFSNSARAQEHVAWRLALHEHAEYTNVVYSNKKPIVANAHISVSHTCNYAFVLHSTTLCGLDAERITSKAANVRLKFCSTAEQVLFAHYTFNLNEFYTLMWCAKEAIYKRYNDGYSFINEIEIRSINTQCNQIIAAIHTPNINEVCTVYYLQQNNMYIAYVL